MNSELASEKQVAIHAVLESIPLCQQVETDMEKEDTVKKEDGSPVTVADFATQAFICQVLGEAFPEDPIVAGRRFSGVAGKLANDAACDRIRL